MGAGFFLAAEVGARNPRLLRLYLGRFAPESNSHEGGRFALAASRRGPRTRGQRGARRWHTSSGSGRRSCRRAASVSECKAGAQAGAARGAQASTGRARCTGATQRPQVSRAPRAAPEGAAHQALSAVSSRQRIAGHQLAYSIRTQRAGINAHRRPSARIGQRRHARIHAHARTPASVGTRASARTRARRPARGGSRRLAAAPSARTGGHRSASGALSSGPGFRLGCLSGNLGLVWIGRRGVSRGTPGRPGSSAPLAPRSVVASHSLWHGGLRPRRGQGARLARASGEFRAG